MNLFLLFILVNFRWQSAQTRRDMIQQLHELFTANDVVLDEDLDLDTQPLPTLSVQRNLEMEEAIAETLLEEEVDAVHQGGGIYSYTGTTGTVHFRSNGNFDYAPVGQDLDDPEGFCREFCEQYGYQVTANEIASDGTGTFSAVQVAGGVVYNCTVTFEFQKKQLINLSGVYVSTEGSTQLQATSLSAIDALIRFLDYRNQSGAIYNTIRSIEPVYELQSSPTVPMQLTAKWQITTDTYQYYVDCTSGEIVRG